MGLKFQKRKIFVLRAIFKPFANATWWRLTPREMCNPKTLENARAAGVLIVSKEDVPDFVFEDSYGTPGEAKAAAEVNGCGVLSVQKLSAMARGK